MVGSILIIIHSTIDVTALNLTLWYLSDTDTWGYFEMLCLQNTLETLTKKYSKFDSYFNLVAF